MTATIESPMEKTPTATTTSVVCQKCKAETGITAESILMNDIIGDFFCPSCNEIVFSSIPEIKKCMYAGYVNYSGYGEYD